MSPGVVRWALALAIAAQPAFAQTPGVDVPPAPSAARALQWPPLHELRLDNGLRVVVAQRDALPLVSATVLLLTGPEADPAGRAGLAATTVALLGTGALRGGKPTGAAQLVRQAEALGGSLDLDSRWHASTLTMTVTTPKLDAAVALLADIVRRPLLAADELARVRDQQSGELRIQLNDPSAVALMAARRAFWAGTRYAASATAASLHRLRQADVKAFHRRWYRPDNAALVLVGDIDAARARDVAQAAFGSWRAPVEALPALPAITGKRNRARLVLIDMPGSGQSSVLLALPFDAAGSAEQRAIAEVSNAVLGLGYSARLNQQVRIARGLSYGIGSELELHPDASLLLAQGQTDHRNATQVLQVLRDELRHLGEAVPSAEELQARQATLVGNLARSLDTVGSLNRLIVDHLAQGRDLDSLKQQVDRIGSVSAAQVRDFAAAQWPDARQHAVVAGETARVGAWAETEARVLRVPLRDLDLDRGDLVRPRR